jgi:hypothetical protein
LRECIANVQKIPRRKTKKLHKDIAQRDTYQKVLDLKLKQKPEGEEVIDRLQNRWELLE